MSPLISPLINSVDAPWTKVAGIYRRICILRASGRDADADRVHREEFLPARAAAEQETHFDASPDLQAMVNALFDAEDARVAEALMFAEMLAPLIAERLRPPVVLEPIDARAPFPSDREPSHPPFAPRDATPVNPSIADLIDGMLGQERGERRRS